MAEPKFHVVRAIAGQGLSNARILAKNFGVSKSAIDKHIANAHDTLLARQPELQLSGDHFADRSLTIAKASQFFGFGVGAALRKLPRRLIKG